MLKITVTDWTAVIWSSRRGSSCSSVVTSSWRSWGLWIWSWGQAHDVLKLSEGRGRMIFRKRLRVVGGIKMSEVIYSNETRQDKTRQDKTRQDKTRQDKTRQDKTRQDKTRQDKELEKGFSSCLLTIERFWRRTVAICLVRFQFLY